MELNRKLETPSDLCMFDEVYVPQWKEASKVSGIMEDDPIIVKSHGRKVRVHRNDVWRKEEYLQLMEKSSI